MKAQARKILALIMAMVMCLSLAAPAFAEAEEAAESSAPAAVEVEETKDEEKKEEKLEKQEVADAAIGLDYKPDTNGDGLHDEGYVVKFNNNLPDKEYNWAVANEYVDLGTENTPAIYGQDGSIKYTAKLKTNASVKVDYTQTLAAKSILDDAQWTTSADKTIEVAGTGSDAGKKFNYSRKGWVIGKTKIKISRNDEPQEVYIYRLVQTTNNAFDTTKPYVYAANVSDNVLSESTLYRMNQTGNGEITFSGAIAQGDRTVTVIDEVVQTETYAYAFKDGSEVTTGGTAALPTITLAEGKQTGTIKVKKYNAVNNAAVPVATTEPITEFDSFFTNCDIVSLGSADPDGYQLLTVRARKQENGSTPTKKNDPQNNTKVYLGSYKWNADLKKSEEVKDTVDSSDPTNESKNGAIGLIDTATAGKYTETTMVGGSPYTQTKDLSTTDGVVYGTLQVVKVPDCFKNGTTVSGAPISATGADEGHTAMNTNTTFLTVEALQYYGQMQNMDDSKDITVEVKQEILNDKINGVTNGTTKQTRTFTVTIPKGSVHTLERKAISSNPTCKQEGETGYADVCKYDGVELNKNVQTIAKISAPVTTSGNSDNWTVTANIMIKAEQYNALSATDKAKYERVPESEYYVLKHYIAERVVTDYKPATKTTEGSVTYTYYCNLKHKDTDEHGECHDDLTVTVPITKVNLEHKGDWSVVDWGQQNPNDVRDPEDFFGFTPAVFDVDYDYSELPMNQTGHQYMDFAHNDDYWYDARNNIYVSVATATNVDVVNPSKSTATNHVMYTPKKSYAATLTASNVKLAEKQCLDGTATLTINVYDLTLAADGTALALHSAVNQNPDEVYAKTNKLVYTETKNVVIPAEKTHVDANNDGKCDNCEAEINQTTPINENTVDISKAVVKFDALTYTGKVAQPTVTVTLDGVKLAKGVDYEVEEMQVVNAGTHPLIVKGKGDFSGRVVGNVTIKKAKQKLTVKATAPSAKKLKSKAQTLKYTVSGNKTAYTVKAKGPVKVKKGVVTVKKSTKKGKKITLTVTAAADANYKKASKTITVKVKA